MVQTDDITLITQMVDGSDKRAFDQIVRRYQSRERKFFLAQTLGDSQLSDDLAQDTFVKAYTHITSFRGTSQFATWLMRIAYNTYYDYCRSMHPTADIDTVSVHRGGSSTTDTMIRRDIYEALARLTEMQRTCITMQLMDGRPIDEIAEITALPLGTVKSHLKRGKDLMVEFLKRNGY